MKLKIKYLDNYDSGKPDNTLVELYGRLKPKGEVTRRGIKYSALVSPDDNVVGYLKDDQVYNLGWDDIFNKEGNSGYDVRAAISEPLVIHPGDRAKIPLGIAVELENSYEYCSEDTVRIEDDIYAEELEIQIRPRSGLACKGLINIIGTVDYSYRGEICAIICNLNCPLLMGDDGIVYKNTGGNFVINPGDRIAQMIISEVQKPEIVVVNSLSETDRGANGFGSTGVK